MQKYSVDINNVYSCNRTMSNSSSTNRRCSIRLIALDFDGTCANYQLTPHIDNLVTLQLEKAQKGEIDWLINSGRSFNDLMSIVTNMPKSLRPRAILSQQREIHLLGNDGTYHPHTEWNNCQMKKHSELWRQLQHDLSTWSTKIQQYFDVQMSFVNNEACSFMVAPEKVEQLGNMLSELVCDRHEVVVSGNHEWRFLVHRDFSKGALLAETSRIMNVSNSEILAIGDNLNDKTMLLPNVAGLLGCPSNASKEIRHIVRIHGGVIALEENAQGTASILNKFL